MEKTLKQLADELKIDKQRVYRYVKKECITEAHQQSGVKYFDEAAQTRIFSHFSKKECITEAHQDCITDTVSDTVNDTLISMLQRELEIKNKQIDDLNERLAETTSALLISQEEVKAAQALHAGTIQHQLIGNESDLAVTEQPLKKKHWWKRNKSTI